MAIRGILPRNVRVIITKLCLFFNTICSKIIDPEDLDDLEHEAEIILCQLEMFFSPSFFDIMNHLVVHIVREIRIYGPVYLRWMYLVERYMKFFKGYTKNHHRPEASIVERHITKENIDFCINYLSEASSIRILESRHDECYDGRCIQGLNVKTFGREVILKAYLYILNNLSEVQPYLTVHKSLIKEKLSWMNERWLLTKHNKTFINWFNKSFSKECSPSDTIKLLSHMPKL